MIKLRFEYAVYLLLFGLYAAFAAIIPTSELSSDILYWIRWTTYIRQHGFDNTYELQNNNYSPLYQYLLLLYTQLVGNGSLEKKIYFLKIITLLFDFGGALLAASFVAERKQKFFFTLLLLLNASYLYTTLVWGQVDSIYACLTFTALVLSLRERPIWSAFFYVLALNAKLQALIFLPVLLLLWFPQWVRVPKRLLGVLLTVLSTQALLLLPFLSTHGLGYLTRIGHNTFGSINYYSVVSMYCFNLWHLLLGSKSNLAFVPDSTQFAGVSYHHWGLLLFALSLAVLLLPLLLVSVHNSLTRSPFSPAEYGLLFLSAGLIPILLSYFNTQMHSRYVHASILLLGTYTLLTGRYFLFLVTSIAYLLNLVVVVNIFNFYNLRLAWNPQYNMRFIASLYTVVVAAGFWEVYRHYSLKEHLAEVLFALRTLPPGYGYPRRQPLTQNKLNKIDPRGVTH